MEYTIWTSNVLQPHIRKKYGWLVKAKNIKELLKKYPDAINHQRMLRTMPYKNYLVTYEFWYHSEAMPRTGLTRTYYARNEAEAMYLLKQDMEEPLGVYSIENVEENK